jgi:hypothetical protein
MPCPLNRMDLPAPGAYIEKISRKKERHPLVVVLGTYIEKISRRKERHPLIVSEAWQENFIARGFAECLA